MSVRQYIGARYVTKIYENSLDPSSAEWEQGTFDPLVMVTWQNSTYLSKKQVPGSVGNPADNPNYWVCTGYYNGQIMQLQADIQDIINTINGYCVSPEMFGAAGDGVTDDTNAIIAAVSSGKNVMFGYGATYLVDGALNDIFVASNVTLYGNGCTIKQAATSEDGYVLLYVRNAENVTIKDFNLVGDRDIHTGSTGEYGFAVRVRGGRNITIENCNISKCWGDGIYVGDDHDNNVDYSSNVVIKDCQIFNSRRNNISITSCDGLIIDGCSLTLANGTAPKAGIDFESHSYNYEVIKNCMITNCNFFDNAAYHILFADLTDGSNITVNNCSFDHDTNDTNACISAFASGITGVSINITGCDFIKVGKNLLLMGDFDSGNTLNLENSVVIDGHTINSNTARQSLFADIANTTTVYGVTIRNISVKGVSYAGFSSCYFANINDSVMENVTIPENCFGVIPVFAGTGNIVRNISSRIFHHANRNVEKDVPYDLMSTPRNGTSNTVFTILSMNLYSPVTIVNNNASTGTVSVVFPETIPLINGTTLSMACGEAVTVLYDGSNYIITDRVKA